MGSSGSSSDPAPPEPRPREPREPKKKTVSQECWVVLKSATVKITEADGLKNKLISSGMLLDWDLVTAFIRVYLHDFPYKRLRPCRLKPLR